MRPAHNAHCDEFVREIRDAYDTIIGEREGRPLVVSVSGLASQVREV